MGDRSLKGSLSGTVEVIDLAHVILNGTVDLTAGVKSVQIFDESYSGQGYLGDAVIEADGTWTFTDDLSFRGYQYVDAVVKGSNGFQNELSDQLFIDNRNYAHQLGTVYTSASDYDAFIIGEETFDPSAAYPLIQTESHYGQYGRLLYTGYVVVGAETTNLVQGIGPNVPFQYADLASNTQTITNYHVDGAGHDLFNLVGSGILSMTQLLQHTTNDIGGATIHFSPSQSVTLQGVTKQQIAAHSKQFKFGNAFNLLS